MVFSSVSTAAQLEFPRTSWWSMVSILDLLHRFLFQFIKTGSDAMLNRSCNAQELRVVIM